MRVRSVTAPTAIAVADRAGRSRRRSTWLMTRVKAAIGFNAIALPKALTAKLPSIQTRSVWPGQGTDARRARRLRERLSVNATC